MIDFDILNSYGSTNERLRELFTLRTNEDPAIDRESEEGKKRVRDHETRERFRKELRSRLQEHVSFSLSNHQLYSAVDLAWDSSPVSKETVPLMLYAQNKIDISSCSSKLKGLRCAEPYLYTDDKGEVTGIDLPKFFEVNINLIRSIITRRLAAQSNKYSNLYPFYKYESRSTGVVGKLRADVTSQIVDVICDQYDYRHHDVQVVRDTLLYGHSVDFPRCSWERDVQWKKDGDGFNDANGRMAVKSELVREGITWCNPHPSRVFWDNAYPLSSINSDTGCEYVGYWDVKRFGDIHNNPMFFNRDHVGYSTGYLGFFTGYADYFNQYYCTVKPPVQSAFINGPEQNDRLSNVGLYSGERHDESCMVYEYFRKIKPLEWGVGEYPFPVWVRFVVAGDDTVIFAEFMPSRPAAYCGFNENDSRLVNISLAHELMPFQDQLTNLFSQLLMTLKADNFKVMVVDVDYLSEEQLKSFRKQATGTNYYSKTHVIEVSRKRLQEMGLDAAEVVKLVETRPGEATNLIFKSILQLLSMVERLMILSPNEQGQPSPREISATETVEISNSTTSVYNFISDSIDEFRSAKKRIVYESFMCCGSKDVRVPVLNRYTSKAIKAAGFIVSDGELDVVQDYDARSPKRHTLSGWKGNLLHDYIFTSRDGAERTINSQAATTLVQLVSSLLVQPNIMEALGKEKFYEIINEIFRLSGTGVDLNLELKDGENDGFGVSQDAQVMQIIEQLVQQVQQSAQDTEQMKQILSQAIEELGAIKAAIPPLPPPPQPFGAGGQRLPQGVIDALSAAPVPERV